MFEQVQEQRQRDVMLASSPAAAEFVAATLAVHGVYASTVAYDRAYPSIDWVRGYRVRVAAHEEERAREILAALSGRSDVAPPPEADRD